MLVWLRLVTLQRPEVLRPLDHIAHEFSSLESPRFFAGAVPGTLTLPVASALGSATVRSWQRPAYCSVCEGTQSPLPIRSVACRAEGSFRRDPPDLLARGCQLLRQDIILVLQGGLRRAPDSYPQSASLDLSAALRIGISSGARPFL